MKSDLIERVKNLALHGPPDLTEDQLEVLADVVTALSPALPDDVARNIAELKIGGWDEAADLLERQQCYVSGLRTANASMQAKCAGQELRIEELEAPVLPDDVARVLGNVRNAIFNAEKREAVITAEALQEAANLLERQARQIIESENTVLKRLDTENTKLAVENSNLRAALKGIAARRDCYNDINGCGAAQTAKAALAERNK